jgi:hypothetical protein
MNSQYFSEEQVKAGEMDAFLKALRAQDYGKGGYYNDVHIKPADCGAYSVDWAQLRWEGDDDKGFEYIDSEHVLMLEKEMPDGTFEQFFNEEDYEMVLKDWLEDQEKNGLIWKKNEYGHWYEEGEQKRWQEMLDKQHDKGAVEDID